MLAKEETQTGLAAEIKNIPTWTWVLAGIAFVAAQWFFNVAVARHPQLHPIPAWGRPLLGLLAGILGGCYLLLIGYITRDAKRRGMSRTLWTILAIVIPNALGIILYFLLRLPLRTVCPQCGNVVQPG
ncbi:MAG: PLDc N-terminal domain-containing protein, partial [Acidobacteria bacterium]|nr:PLDc N-terminal domain-containing protein [Acidobacteriota bacterium]